MRHFITYIFILALSLLAAAAPIPGELLPLTVVVQD
jgi:hypothetical protein